DEIVGIYGEVLAEHARRPEDTEDTRTASVYLQWLGPFLKKQVTQAERTAHHLLVEREKFRVEGERLRTERDQGLRERDRLEVERSELQALCEQERANSDRLRDERERALAELAILRGSTTFRLRDRVLETPLLGGLARLALRVAKSRWGLAAVRPRIESQSGRGAAASDEHPSPAPHRRRAATSSRYTSSIFAATDDHPAAAGSWRRHARRALGARSRRPISRASASGSPAGKRRRGPSRTGEFCPSGARTGVSAGAASAHESAGRTIRSAAASRLARSAASATTIPT